MSTAVSRRDFLAILVGGLATRPGWTQAGPSPLVPREIFFGDPDVTWARMSWDGTLLAYIAPVDGVRNLWMGRSTTCERPDRSPA
jgi:hypothetical protein